MDFSPYRKKSTPLGAGEYKKYFPIFIILGSIGVLLIAFLLFRSLFAEEGTPITATFQKTEGSVVENQMSGIDIWSLISEGENITEGDKIRVLSGPPSFILLKNGSKISIGSGGEVLMQSLKENNDGLLFGEMLVSSGPVGFESNGNTDPEKSFIIWVDENHYIKASQGSLVIQDRIIHVVKGEGIEAIEQNTKGKITNQKLIGVGQSLDISNFAVKATEESVKFLPLYAMIIAGDGSIPDADAKAVDTTLSAPIITSPQFTGSAITISDPLQKIEGSVGANAVKVVVSFQFNGQISEQEIPVEELTSLTSEVSQSPSAVPAPPKSWSFIASPTYSSLASGINTYKFYAVNKSGERSSATIIALQYDEKSENVFDSKGGELMITSPNQGKSGPIEENVITITGTAPKDAVKIVVTNKKLQNPYALKQFTAGNATWKYYTAEMEAGIYPYTIEAYSATGTLLGTKNITITVGGTSPTSTPKANAPSSSPSSETKSSTPKPTIIPSATLAPTVNSSTLEATR